MFWENFVNLVGSKKILILGFGDENRQFLDWLIQIANFDPNQILIADKKNPNSQNLEILQKLEIKEENCSFGENYLDILKDFTKIEFVFKSPGIWSESPELEFFREQKAEFDQASDIKKIYDFNQKSEIKVFGQINKKNGQNSQLILDKTKTPIKIERILSPLVFFVTKFREQIIGVTGTKGKTTTSSLIEHFLKAKIADFGNKNLLIANHMTDVDHPTHLNEKIWIYKPKVHYCGNTSGVSPYKFWTNLEQNVDLEEFFVVELSSFQLQDLGYSEISPKFAVISNYFVDHLDQHLHKFEYWKAKSQIFLHQKPTDFLISNEQFLEQTEYIGGQIYRELGNSKVADFDFDKPSNREFIIISEVSKFLKQFYKTSLLGEHNWQNLVNALFVSEIVCEIFVQNKDQIRQNWEIKIEKLKQIEIENQTENQGNFGQTETLKTNKNSTDFNLINSQAKNEKLDSKANFSKNLDQVELETELEKSNLDKTQSENEPNFGKNYQTENQQIVNKNQQKIEKSQKSELEKIELFLENSELKTSKKITFYDILQNLIRHEKSQNQKIIDTFQPVKHRLEMIKTIQIEIQNTQKNIFENLENSKKRALTNSEFSSKSPNSETESAKTISVRFWDDGAATEPDAVIACVNALTEKNEFLWLWIAGIDKGADLGELANKILQKIEANKISKLTLCGQIGANLLAKIEKKPNFEKKYFDKIQIFQFRSELNNVDFESEISYLLQKSLDQNSDIPQENLVLNIALSPCGSSFDEFANYKERSEFWRQNVEKLGFELNFNWTKLDLTN